MEAGQVAVWFTKEEKIAVLEAAGYKVTSELLVITHKSPYGWKVIDESFGYVVRDAFGEPFGEPEKLCYWDQWLDRAFDLCLRKMLSTLTAGAVKPE